eukprot:bmy_21535T0
MNPVRQRASLLRNPPPAPAPRIRLYWKQSTPFKIKESPTQFSSAVFPNIVPGINSELKSLNRISHSNEDDDDGDDGDVSSHCKHNVEIIILLLFLNPKKKEYSNNKKKTKIVTKTQLVLGSNVLLVINSSPSGATTMSGKSLLLKVILLGDGGVGKSSLMNRYVTNKFDSQAFHTIGVEFLNRDLEVDGRFVTLQIWDTAGQERFKSLRTPFYRGADCCLLTFSVDDRQSFENLGNWQKEFIYYADVKDPEHFPFVVLGNKVDKEDRQVTTEEAQAWCMENGDYPYLETSAKDDTNVTVAFEEAVRQVLAVEEQLEHCILNLEPSRMKELKSYSYPLKHSINQLTNVTINSCQAVSDMSAKGEKNKTLSRSCDIIGKGLQYLIDAKTLFKKNKFLRGILKNGKRFWYNKKKRTPGCGEQPWELAPLGSYYAKEEGFAKQGTFQDDGPRKPEPREVMALNRDLSHILRGEFRCPLHHPTSLACRILIAVKQKPRDEIEATFERSSLTDD